MLSCKSVYLQLTTYYLIDVVVVPSLQYYTTFLFNIINTYLSFFSLLITINRSVLFCESFNVADSFRPLWRQCRVNFFWWFTSGTWDVENVNILLYEYSSSFPTVCRRQLSVCFGNEGYRNRKEGPIGD